MIMLWTTKTAFSRKQFWWNCVGLNHKTKLWFQSVFRMRKINCYFGLYNFFYYIILFSVVIQEILDSFLIFMLHKIILWYSNLIFKWRFKQPNIYIYSHNLLCIERTYLKLTIQFGCCMYMIGFISYMESIHFQICGKQIKFKYYLYG